MAPKKVGRYEIIEQLGRGGMSTIYRANDPRFNRDVAVKILPRELTLDPQFRARFDREAQTIAALEHPAIVPVHDYGEEEGQPYLIMRLMQGGSLADRLKDGPLPVSEVSQILDRIGSALDRAHEAGVIHRDLKPGNILFDQYGDAYLADFGIARMANSSATLTGSGLIGTPAYMSPEQIEGKAVDGRTDIYALGIIVFEMLTGERPYQADTPAMLLVKQMTEPMPRVLDVKPDLPPGCEDVITRATAKQVAARYEKASQLAETLSSALRHQARPEASIAAAPPAPPPPPATAVSPASDLAPTKPTEPKTTAARQPLPRWLWGVVVLGVLGLLAIFLVPRMLDAVRTNNNGSDRQTAVPGAITPENVPQLMPQNQFGRGTIDTAVLSPDSRLLAVGGSAGIWIYDAHTLELHQHLQGHAGLVSSVAWSPDGRRLASGSWDQTVRIWQVESGEQIGEIPHPDQVIALDWSPNGNLLASATWGSQISLWEPGSGNSLGELSGHRESITHLAFSPDGTLLASASADSARLWHVERREEIALLTDIPSERGSLRWSANGERLLLANLQESTVQVWNAAGDELFVLTGMEYGVYDAVWSPDNALLVTTSGDGAVQVWGGLVGRRLRLLPTFNFNSTPVRLSWLAEGNQLLLVLDNGVLAVVDAEGRQVSARTAEHTAVSGAVAFSPDGTRLALGHSDGSVRIHQAGSEAPVVLPGHAYGVTAVAWSPTGSGLVSTGGDGVVRLWDVAQQAERLQWPHPEGEVSALAWSPAEPLVAIADFGGHLWLWDVEANDIRAERQIHDDAVSGLAWSPDGSELASSSWDGTARVWQAQSGEGVLTLAGHTDAVRAVAWSPDGSRLATVSHDFTVRVWDRASGELIWQEAHQELATSVAWSPDGRLLATGGWDMTIRIWNAETGDPLAQLHKQIGPIIALDWAPDGTALVSGSEDGTAVLWRLP